jgi:cytochrome P450
LVFARILDQNMVVINSQHVAQALLDKRSGIYSDRPYVATVEPCVLPVFTYIQSIWCSDRSGWSVNFAFTGYNDEWRRCRRLFHQTFRPDSALKFRPMQMRRAREMIVNLIDNPQHYRFHFATSADAFANIELLLTCLQVHVIDWDVYYIWLLSWWQANLMGGEGTR